MAVHFKFKSAREFDKLDIEGPFVLVSLLKDKIVEAKNLGKAADFDLVLTNAQTGEEYADENFLVPKNTSVIVKRVPSTRPKAGLHHVRKPELEGASVQDAERLSQVDEFGAELAAQPIADEELKLQAAVVGTATDWQQQQSQQVAGRGGRGFGRGNFGGRGFGGRNGGYNAGFSRGPPPPGYVCHRCGVKGHWIQDCPTNGDPDLDNRRRALKPPVGIPKSMLATAEEGSYLLPSGEFAMLRPDETEFAKHAARLMANRPTARAIPPENQCSLCGNLFRDAVMVPCCHESFCDQCIREELLKNGKCPSCGATHITNDDLLPNVALRKAIERFKSEQAAAPSTSSADDKGHRAADVTVVQSAPKSPSPLSRAPEDLHTRNSSGAESSAHVYAADMRETLGREFKADGSERALSGRAAGGVDVGSEAVKSPERARSPLYNSELQRPRFPGGPDKEMADAMVARAGDWSDMNGGPGAAPYGGVAVNKARMKELQEQHRCHICGSADHLASDCPEHPTPDFPPAHMARQFPGFPGGQAGPYPGPDFFPPPGNGFFPGPQPFPRPFPRPFGGPPMGLDSMSFDPRWGPNGPPRGIPPPFGGPEPFFPPGNGYVGIPRPRMPGPAGFLSREEFQRKQEEARRALESKKRSDREESSDGSERSHKHKSKKHDKEEKKHKKSRKEGRYTSQERGRDSADVLETEAETKPSRRQEKDRDAVSPSRYDREVANERGSSDIENRRRERSPVKEDSGRRSSKHRGSSAYSEGDHWTPNEDVAHRSSRMDEYGGANSPKHGVFSRLRIAESNDADRRARSARSHHRDPSKEKYEDIDGRGSFGRESSRRRDGHAVEDDDRWIA